MNSIENQGDPTGPEAVAPELQALTLRYPRLFRDEPPPHGSEVPAGCVESLDRLCKDIDSRLSEEQALQLRLLRFKASEGAFRVYWSIDDPDSAGLGRSLHTLQVLADSAEAAPDATCYFIGAAGLTRYLGGWVRMEYSGLTGSAAEVAQ